MSKYHINPQTGNPGLCRAQSGNCPFGSDDEHYPSKQEARTAFEVQQKINRLDSLLDTRQLRQMLDEGYVNASVHPDDPTLKVLCYTQATQFAGKWNGVTKTCRGLIVRDPSGDFAQAEIVQRPWRKFYTLSQIQGENGNTGWALGDEEEGAPSVESEIAKLDFSAPAEVLDKVDGSLGILYRAPDGLPAFSTKGSFVSDQAQNYTQKLRNNVNMLGEAESLLDAKEDKTFLFELVGPENRIVINYDEEDIVLLGAVDKASGKYMSPTDYDGDWSGTTTEVMAAHNLGDAFALPDRPDREGVVIRIYSDDPNQQMQIKVKQEDYKLSARILSNLDSNKVIREALRDSRVTGGDILAMAQDGDIHHIDGLGNFFDKYDTTNPVIASAKEQKMQLLTSIIVPRAQRFKAAQDYVSALPDEFLKRDNPAKDFALMIQSEKELAKGDLFTLFQARMKGVETQDLPLRKFSTEISHLLKADG
jgi:hypothetical protein